MLSNLASRRQWILAFACCSSVVGCAIAQDQSSPAPAGEKPAMSSHAADKMTAPPKANEAMQKVLDELAALNPKPIETLTPEEARKQPTPADAVTKLKKQMDLSTAMPAGVDTDDRKLGDTGVPVRVYTPSNTADNAMLPTVVYIHGGGFVIASNDVYDASPRSLCKQLNAIVVSVEYPKAPEHPFPASHQASYAVTQWVLNHANEIKGDPNKVAIVGESAGGNMATAVCLMAKDMGGKMPVAQVLIYPVVDNDTENESYTENANAKPLGKGGMKWFFTKEGQPAPEMKKYLLPLKNADVAGLPPATVIGAQIDPLRTEGKLYADKLKAAGVDTEYKLFDGVTHEFFGMADVLPEAKDAQALVVSRLKKAFMK